PLALNSFLICGRGPITSSPNHRSSVIPSVCEGPRIWSNAIGQSRGPSPSVRLRMTNQDSGALLPPPKVILLPGSEKRRLIVVIVARQKIQISGDLGVLHFYRGETAVRRTVTMMQHLECKPGDCQNNGGRKCRHQTDQLEPDHQTMLFRCFRAHSPNHIPSKKWR